MNWSEYLRFVGDVFGAPLAIEGLLAFFFEATFIGLWIFGWGSCRAGLHLATIWAARSAAILSAYFIIAANAFMQNPVGFEMNDQKGRAELVDIGVLLINPVALAAFPHTISASFMVAAGLVITASAWHPARNQHLDTMRPALKFGLWVMVGAGILTTLFGDQLSLAMVATQPMKMAAAEATYDTVCGADASFSLFTLGTPDGRPSCSRSGSRTCSHSSRRIRSTAASRASTTCRRVHGAVRSRRLLARSSGSRTGRSAG